MENQIQDPITPTPPPQVTPPAVSPVFPKKNNLAVILLSISLLVTLSATVYLFLRVQSLTKQLVQLQVQPTPTPLSTEIPSPTPDPTADWKTYTNQKYGFEFKYPTSWLESICPKNLYKVDLCFQSPNYSMDNRQIPSSGGLLLIEVQKNGLEIVDNSNFCQISNDDLYVCKKIDLQNISGWKRNYGIYETDAGILKNNKFVLGLRIRYPRSNEETEILAVFDQILSTFKFTE